MLVANTGDIAISFGSWGSLKMSNLRGMISRWHVLQVMSAFVILDALERVFSGTETRLNHDITCRQDKITDR